MKRNLLFSLCFLFTIFYSNAQVIDIIGKGVSGESSSNLPLTNLFNIESVRVEALYKGEGSPNVNGVIFSNSLGESGSDYSPISNKTNVGKFYKSFTTYDESGLFSDINIENIYSYYEYIYRDSPVFLHKSYFLDKTAYMYHNGSGDPVKYNITIDKATAPRDVVVKIPITELNDDERVAIIDVKIRNFEQRIIVKKYNTGPSFHLGEYTFKNVPASTDLIEISIFSPTRSEAEAMGYIDGDSFIVSGIVVDVQKVYDGCTLTQGYWKNHSDCPRKGNGPKRDNTWDKLPEAEATIFFDSEQNYCEVFAMNPGKGGKYYILAHQYMAAELNLLNNADPTAIVEAFTEATEFLTGLDPDEVKGNKALEAKCVKLGGILDDYNNGRIGPGHCDEDNDDEAHITPIKQKMSKIKLYPNPSSGFGKISFTPKQEGNTSVDLYNMSGQKVGVLYNQRTKKEQEITIDFNTDKFNSGLYIAIIKNGSDVYKEKISVVK